MNTLVLSFQEMDDTQLHLVGGKGLNLGKLAAIPGINVPEGFCVTTEGFKQALLSSREYPALLQKLNLIHAEDRTQIADISGRIRQAILEAEISSTVVHAVAHYLSRFGEQQAYAIRSSATAEDLPQASFAGQQDSYLNITSLDAVLQHIRKCWASLYTDRAVVYRIQNGFDHSQVHLAVIIQKMIIPQASGIMFTADPVTCSRKLLTIDAGFGLGEAMVSGLVTPDSYKVQGEDILEQRIGGKQAAVYALKEGGTEIRPVAPGQQQEPALTAEQVLRLARTGREIEAYFGSPQDIEWCLAGDEFYIVQSRPVTTLYPVPEVNDQDNHVYVSVGHQQMMTDSMKPLGLSFYLMITPAPMTKAGGRLFVDIARMLATPEGCDLLLNNLGGSDPLFRDAIQTIIEREFIPITAGRDHNSRSGRQAAPPAWSEPAPAPDPAAVKLLIRRNEASVEELRQTIRTKSGAVLMDYIQEDVQQLKQLLFDPQSISLIMAGMNASAWINEQMNEWLGEKNAADTLSQSVPDNITSEMGLALLDVADVIRPYPEVIGYLQQFQAGQWREEMAELDGGVEALKAVQAYLDKYGMRCTGEIDITRTRWSEQPSILFPLILNNIKNAAPGASRQKFARGLEEAMNKEQELISRLMQLPDGEQKAAAARQQISLIRNFSGYREYPKYGIVNRYFVYKQALLKEAELLVQEGHIQTVEDIFYLTFQELRETVSTGTLDYRLISNRKEEYEIYDRLTPPRMMTSDGEIITGRYHRGDLPEGALAGLPVSAGVVEGRARVIGRIEEANLEAGDILVTAFTDPSWTPLFVSIKGLVTEVGGLMTHGAVIAREYGLPAVVGVEQATSIIQDGQRIRVHGTEGYIEIL
ncbi:phosphoenolpyruvate synthase [Paenibacillus sp. MMS20-IR301]|uniref:phosphoenolpyruvate synthase n=1 Tax=Paenibacillus sp. MMS20-IR301 TaxID=2895946 RepID=UPI0028E6CA97|nr:phosphoenolpyruvate synthase [Paenibacillus sp. MMS20-IR301]WNS45231.1 phosphoenolpyruvate synthase [Paenibacillus sp. MMS20-IR301]